MKVGIISDTHDNLPYIKKAVKLFVERGCKAVIHAGDYVAPFALKEVLAFPGPVYGVLGNNDGEHEGLRKLLPELADGPLRVQLDACTIVVAHDEKQLTDADRAGADVIVVGHYHRPCIEGTEPLIVNPGECAGWLTGEPTVAILDTETRTAELIKLGEWS